MSGKIIYRLGICAIFLKLTFSAVSYCMNTVLQKQLYSTMRDSAVNVQYSTVQKGLALPRRLHKAKDTTKRVHGV